VTVVGSGVLVAVGAVVLVDGAAQLAPTIEGRAVFDPSDQRIGDRLTDLGFEANQISPRRGREVDAPRHEGSWRTSRMNSRSACPVAQ
jgi:hypothetical protein